MEEMTLSPELQEVAEVLGFVLALAFIFLGLTALILLIIEKIKKIRKEQ